MKYNDVVDALRLQHINVLQHHIRIQHQVVGEPADTATFIE